MKLNWAERWVVNNPVRVMMQRAEIRWLKKRVVLDPGAVVLEVGCGRGAGARLIQKAYQPALLHASDLDVKMVLSARDYLCSGGRKRVSLHAGDVEQLPIKDGSLDAVFGFGVLHHALDWQGSVAEIARVLRIGGVYFIEELYPPLYQNVITKHILLHPTRNRFLSRDLRRHLMDVGLPITEAIESLSLGILGVAVKQGE